MRISMKNDLDLIRAILEEVESRPDAEGEIVEVSGVDLDADLVQIRGTYRF